MNAKDAKNLSNSAPEIQPLVETWLEHIHSEIETASRIGKYGLEFPAFPQSGAVEVDPEMLSNAHRMVRKRLESEGYRIEHYTNRLGTYIDWR